MNIALAFHAGDLDQAQRWIKWVAELGSPRKHAFYLMPSKGMKLGGEASGILDPLFKSVAILHDYEGISSDWSAGNAPVRDASGPNSMLRQFAWHFHLNKLGPWLFIEPDAIPLSPDWADRIEVEYRASGKLYMGARVPKNGETPEHSTGNMVLPQDAAVIAPSLMLPRFAEFPDGKRVQVAFDVAGAPDVFKSFHETRLIQHVFRGPELTNLRDIRDDAVIFHTCKKGEIIPLLRAKLSLGNRAEGEPPTAFPVTASLNTPASTEKPKVYTYFSPVPTKEGQLEQRKLIELWKRTWQSNGWFTHVLTEDDARKHPEFDRISTEFSKIPTKNPPYYEMACWNRWLAMACAGGLMTDYDVMNLGLRDLSDFGVKTIPCPGGEFPIILCSNNPVPCAVIATGDQYEKAIEAFLGCTTEIQNGTSHLSDMIAVQQLRFASVDICREYGTEKWGDAKLVHFSHAACNCDLGELRSKVISRVLDGPAADRVESIPPTWIGTVRSRVTELAAMADNHTHRQLIIEEMRKIKLIPKARAR